MEKEHREIRALLSSMAPARAAQAVRLVGLPPDEETAVLAVMAWLVLAVLLALWELLALQAALVVTVVMAAAVVTLKRQD